MKRSDYLLKNKINKEVSGATVKAEGKKRSDYLLKTKLPERTAAGSSFSAPVPKTAEQKEADINRREKNRSVKYKNALVEQAMPEKSFELKDVPAEFHTAPQKNWFEKTIEDITESIKNSYIVQQPLKNFNLQSWEDFTKSTGWTSDDLVEQAIKKSKDGDTVSVHPRYMQKAIENGAYKNDEKLEKVKENIEDIKKSWEYSPMSATFANVGAAAADMGANFAGTLQMLGGDKIPGVNDMLEAAVSASKKAQEEAQSYNKASGDELKSTYAQGMTHLIPYVIMAFATNGASTGSSIASTGMSAVKKGITTLMKNPSFWYSFINGAGEKYRSAMDNGATREQATTNALYALPEAMLEVGGGFGADDVIEKTIGKTTAEEILEELGQNTVGKVGEKLSYDYNKPWFSTEEDAVINPKTMAETAAMTALLTGTMSAATKGISKVTNKNSSTEKSGGNVIQYTAEEADGIRKESQTFRNVIAGADITLGEFFNKWKLGRKQGEKLEKLYLGKASESVKKQIGDLLGYDIPNRDFIITNDAVKHVFDRHGDESTEINRGQVVVDEITIQDLFETINSPDEITKEKRKGTDRLIFKKQTGNGDVTVVEIDNKGRATLAVKTMYINKSTGNTSAKVPVEKTTAPSWTSETTEPNPVDNTNIPQESGTVKGALASSTPGFTETEFSGKITNKQIRALRTIGRALGVNIQIGAPTGNGKGAYNGYYENGNIVIAQDAKNPLEVVLCHEVTHRMKETAPAEYNAFLELAVNASEKLSGTEKAELINRYKTAYSEGTQTEFSDIQALDEIAADFTSRIVKDVKMFERLAQDNRTVATKLLDGIRDFIAKVKSTFSRDKAKADTASQEKYGASISELEAAVAQFEKMLETTEAAVASGNINTAGTDAGGGRVYDLKAFEDGVRFVDVQTDQHLFDGLTENEKGRMATKIIKERFSGKVVGRDNKVFVNGRSAAEYGHPAKRISGLEYDAKMRASTELDNLIDAGTNFRTAPDGADGHIHPKAVDDFKYFDTIFKVGGEYYQGTINILPNFRGDLLTDITQIKNITQDISSSYGKNPKSTFLRDTYEVSSTSNDIIPDSSEKSNRKNSLKTEDLLSPEYGKGTDTSSDKPEGLPPSPQGEGSEGESYIEETKLDKYFDDIEERAQVIQDGETDIGQAEDALMTEPKENKNFFEKVKELPEKVRGSVSHAKRKMVNSGDAIRKIAKTVKDEHLYGTFNRTRSAANIVSDMLQNKQTNIRGQKVGESLEGIILPIKEKGKEYFRNFNFYLLLKHNVSRMSLENKKAEELARAELQQYIKENGDLATMTHEQRKEISRREDDRGLRARKYLELQRKLRAAEEKNKPVLFENTKLPLAADKSRRKAEELLRKHPEFKEHEAKVRKYIENLMQYRIDSGLITQEEADYYKKKYPDYIPTYRNTEENMTWITGMVNVGTAINKAKGGNEKILPLDVALAAMTNKVVKNGQKNILANKVFGLYDKHTEILSGYITDANENGRDLEEDIESLGEEITGNTVGFYKDGKRVELTVTPELFEAFDSLSQMPKEQSAFVKWWAKKVDTYKKLITTYDITFGVRNFLKDFQDALIYSTDTISFLKNFGKAYKEIATNGEMWELYQAAGGLYSSRFEDIQNEGIKKEGKLKKIKEGVAFLNVMIEQAPRLAEFMSVYEKGDPNSPDTLSDALLAAADVTTNFGESGTVGKVINRYFVPFLNPSLQGTAKLVRTFTESKDSKAWIALAVKCTMFGLTAGFFNDLMNKLFGGDDDDYENLPDRIKDNYFLFPVGDSGKYVKLPKGRVVAAFGIVADRIRDGIKGEKVDVGEALSGIADNTLPENPLTNNIFKAAILDAQLFDKESRGRTWYGTDIENETLQSLPAGERFDNSTDYISKALGKTLGVSPKKLNYIVQQYTGGVGRMVLPMLTPKEQKGDSVAGKIGYGLLGILTSNFTTDSKLSNKISGEFYDAVDAAEQAKNSSKGTLADKIVYKHLNRERNMVGTYSAKVRSAEVDNNLTSKERQAAVRAASAERTAYQKTILENLDEYRGNVEKFLKKYPGQDEEKKLEYAYREANRSLYGEEYAIRVNGGADVHKKAEEKVKRGKTTWKKYYEEYFGKTDRRYDAIADRFDISYADFEKIERAISKNSSEADEIAAIKKLGYKYGVARRIYTLYHDTE